MLSLFRVVTLLGIALTSVRSGATDLLFSYNGKAIDKGLSEEEVADIVERYLFADSPKTFRVKVVPVGRVVKTLATADGSYCASSLVRTPERENKFQWVMSLAHAVPKLIATQTEGNTDPVHDKVIVHSGSYFEWLAHERGWNIMPAPNRDSAYRMLLKGRANLLLDEEGMVADMEHALHFKARKIDELPYYKVWLACNKSVKSDELSQIEATLRSAITSGRFPEMYRLYFNSQKFYLD